LRGIAIALLHQRFVSRHIMGVALAEHDPDGETCGVATHMDLGAELAARTTEPGFCPSVLLPVAQRFARTTALSIICSMSTVPPLRLG
jgi:hypothetical protein